MSRVKLLFVLFSLVVLAAPAGAQRRERDDNHGRKRGDAEHKDRDRKAERDDDEDDEREDEDRMENRRGHERDDDEDDDRDDEDEDEGRRGGINRAGCVDANGNNACDITNGSIPSTLPEMVNAVLVSRGQLTRSGRNWLGNTAVSPRFSRSGSRTPSKVTWLNRTGVVSQVWLDNNHDGRADVVRLYRGGKLVRTVRR